MLNLFEWIAFDEIRIEAFLECILKAAAGFARACFSIASPKPRLLRGRASVGVSVHGSAAGSEKYACPSESVERSEERGCASSKIPIFSAAHVEGKLLVLDISNEYLDALLKKLPLENPFELTETVSVPRPGIAADRDASAYARSLLRSYGGRGGAKDRSPALGYALVSCLSLYCVDEAGLARAHSKAVRAVLSALGANHPSVEDSAAMAAALKYAEYRSAKKQ